MDTAYANIGLDANTIWRDAPGDGFQKSSDKLWVKLNYLKEKKHHQVGEKGKVVTVHEVIPQSRLALYGNYSYDNDREMIYNRENPVPFTEEGTNQIVEAIEEPWMMAEVEQEFRRLTRNCSQPYDLYNGFKPIDCVEVEESIQKKYPVLAKKCQPQTIDTEEALETIYLPNPFYRIDDLNQLELQMRITSTKQIWEHPIRNLMSLVNTDKFSELKCSPFSEVEYSERTAVPCMNQPGVFPLPFPSPTPTPPSQTPFMSSFRLIESLGDLGVRRSFRTSSRTSQPAEGKTDLLPVVKKRSSADGHDFNNLTLLSRQFFLSSIMRMCTTDHTYEDWPVNRQDSCMPDHSTFQVPETVLKWLQTGYPTRSKEFTAIQSLSDELRNVRSSLQGANIAGLFKDKSADETLVGRKCEYSSTNFDSLVYRSENLSTSLSSSSSSKLSSSGIKLEISPVSNLSYSTTSSSNLTGSWQTQTSSLWSSRPFNFIGLSHATDVNISRNTASQKFSGKHAKCRPILNSQYKEVTDEDLGFEDGREKRRFIRGMADMRPFQYYGDSSFDELERQAIEQWPSEDRMEIFCPKHLQVSQTSGAYPRFSQVK